MGIEPKHENLLYRPRYDTVGCSRHPEKPGSSSGKSDFHSIGFVHRNVSKRLKSLSVENKRAPCSMVRAARCASEVKLAAVPRGVRSSFRIDQCCSVGTIILAGDCLSHSSTISNATSEGRGVGIIRPLVTILYFWDVKTSFLDMIMMIMHITHFHIKSRPVESVNKWSFYEPVNLDFSLDTTWDGL